jgi:putative endonuclease
LEKKYSRMIRGLKTAHADEASPKDWSVYIVRCGDDSLYTGIAKDIHARLRQHNSGRGAAYTRARLPVTLTHAEHGFSRSEALVREAAIKRLPRERKRRLASGLLAAAAFFLSLASPCSAAPSFTKEPSMLLSSASIQGASGDYPALRLYYIRGSSQVYSALTADGITLSDEAGVRLSSLTIPAIDIAISSITGLSVQPMTGGFRMLYSVIGTTGAFRIYSATSADGFAWANETGTAVNIADGATFAGYPSLVTLQSGDWRLYYIQNSIAGNQTANHRIFTALSTNEGRNWSAGVAALNVRAGQVAATKLTNNNVRLYYTAPLTGGTSDTVVLSAISSNANGVVFADEAGVRVSTSPGTILTPFVTRSTDTFRWRLYYSYSDTAFSTGNVHAATSDAPDPQSVSPATFFNNLAPAQATVLGEIFAPGVTAVLRQTGQADITGAGITRTDDQTFTATFNTQSSNPGFWDLVVTSNGLSTTLANAVYVDFPAGSVSVTDNLMRPRDGTQARVDVTTYTSGRVTAKLFTLDGQFISTLYDADKPVGTATFNWNGRTATGATVASGLYLLKVIGPKLNMISKIVVIK